MDCNTICNGGDKIPYRISMLRGVMEAEDINSEVAVEDIE